MVHFFSDTYSQVLKRVAQTGEPLEQAEVSMLGVTHAEVGYCAAEKWLFPKHLAEAILLHHNLNAASEDNHLVSLLQLVEILGTAMDEGHQKASIIQSITTSIPWGRLPHVESMRSRLPDYIDEMKSAASTAHSALVAQ